MVLVFQRALRAKDALGYSTLPRIFFALGMVNAYKALNE
jgi:hypothetical protein